MKNKLEIMLQALPLSAALAITAMLFAMPSAAAAPPPEAVSFASEDGKTRLWGYLFQPDKPGPYPAVVMLHGRSGPYSSLTRGTYTAETLTMRHKMWGNFWAGHGYLALHVDSFGPRGYPQGFPRHSHGMRPREVSEQFVRPLDAYGALNYLRRRGDVIADRIGLQGWSNGGMAVLATMAQHPPGLEYPTPSTGFRAAIALYPGCRVQNRQGDYASYAPMLIMVASDDDEVSPEACVQFAAEAEARGAPVELAYYEGAHHSYDDPGKRKQSHEPNRIATRDSLRRAAAFFRAYLRPQP